MNIPSVTERQRIVEYVRRWGGSASDAVLDTTSSFFQIPSIEGVIGYRTVDGIHVVYGDPICKTKNISALTQAFHDYSEKLNIPIVYVAASEQFANWAYGHLCRGLIKYGEELSIDPLQEFPSGHKTSLVRRKIRHATQENSIGEEYKGENKKLEQALEDLAENWLKSRKGPQVFTSHIRLFEDRLGKRWFYVKKENEVVGLVVLNRLEEKNGWHLNHLLFTQNASHGTPELLVMTALETLKKEGCSYLSFGSVPGKKLEEFTGISSPASWFAQGMYYIAAKTFHFEGKKMFWDKFQPHTEPSYLLFSRPNIGFKEARALSKALNIY